MHVNLKWVVCVLKEGHQPLFPGKYRYELMVFVFVIAAAALLFTRTMVSLPAIKNCLIFASPAGAMNTVVNLLVMLLSSYPASLGYPVVSAGGIIMTSTLALTVYREKLSKWQITGLVAGVFSVVFLNL